MIVCEKGIEGVTDGVSWEGEIEALASREISYMAVETVDSLRSSGPAWISEADKLVVAFGRGRNDVHRKRDDESISTEMLLVRMYLRSRPDQPVRTVEIIRATGLEPHVVTQAIHKLTYVDPCMAEDDAGPAFYNTEMSERSDAMMRLLLENGEKDELFD